ncbi:hypothetical protein ID866_12166 [Astraeus odoratus]|nr:hypothetical protein ID866_12166 [Astraeus odoratus]
MHLASNKTDAVKDDKWWLALAPSQEDDAPVEGKGKGKATKQLTEVLKIKVLLIKKWKWSGEDEESEDGEEEAEGSRSISALIFELPRQPGEGNCAYVLVDTFQQVLVWDCMTRLEHKWAKMTSNMHCWWDNIVAKYLELNQHVRTMEDNQHEFIRQ